MKIRFVWQLLIFSLFAVVGNAAHARQGAVQGAAPSAPAQPQPTPPNPLEQLENAMVGLVKGAEQAVVSIEVRVVPLNNAVRPGLPEDPEKLAQELMKDGMDDIAIALGRPRIGSGFLVRGGFVVTTYEVVAGMQEPPIVILCDGRRVKAEKTNFDKNANVAVLKVNIDPNIGLNWGDSRKLTAGNLALTIGNQAGFANSASLGLIAGVNRSGVSGPIRYKSLIQFQGVIGNGGSGSPLLNMRGEVIGMVVATPAGNPVQRVAAPNPPERVATRGAVRAKQLRDAANDKQPEPDPEEQSEPQRGQPPAMPRAGIFVFGGLSNTGFAIPAHIVETVVRSLRENVPLPVPGWMGVLIEDAAGEDEGKGVVLTRIYIGKPADRAGILRGDLVIAVNGKPVHSREDMKAILPNILSGQAVRLVLKRGKMTLTRTLVTEPKPSQEVIDTSPYHASP